MCARTGWVSAPFLYLNWLRHYRWRCPCLSVQPGSHSFIPFYPCFFSSALWDFSICCSTSPCCAGACFFPPPYPLLPELLVVSWGVGWGAEFFQFLICLLELKNIWEMVSQPQKNSLQTGGITYWMWNVSWFMKERFYVSIKKHRRSSSKARYHWVLYQQIENTCAFLLAGSHKIHFFCL